ncbi:unnamed protein product [Prorocentrum cordatum]|uniref:Uncharacterized protein n=1 Tax=Prorocentrum cordatum TaxID=2364126 RepID=A0ABN9STV6_9DINO|nr:unnamed protein product [Polarella glacialis]
MGETKLEPDVISLTVYNAGISACAKGEQWQRALALLSEMRDAKLEPTVSYNAGISACEKGEQWQRALSLLGDMLEAKLDPNVISYNAGISACARGEQWQRALSLIGEMREAELGSDSATTLGSARARRADSGCGLWRCSERCGKQSSTPTPPPLP